MPAYGLGAEIGANIRSVAAVLPSAEIVVVDDGSTDQTFVSARQVALEYERVHVLRHETNLGKGAALRTGTRAATGSLIVFLDGDLDLPPGQLPGLLDELARREADVLVGTKRVGMGEGRYPWKRQALSHIFSFVISVLFRLPVSETQTGLKIFRRQVLDAVFADLRIVRYAFDLELLVRAQRAGYRLIEVPVDLRVGASSAPLRLATLWEMGRDTLRIFWWSIRPGS